MVEHEYEHLAKQMCRAIKEMADNEFALENFELYLSVHFDSWLKKYASTPVDLVCEMKEFASIKGF